MTSEEARKGLAKRNETMRAVQNLQKAFKGVIDPLAKAVLHTGAKMAKTIGDTSKSAIDEWMKAQKKEKDKKDPNPFKDEREI